MAVARQPFAPLDSSRLQTLTSLKNRQNALQSLSSPSKRKATVYEDDSENLDPILLASPKRSKGVDGSFPVKDLFKPSQFVLTKAPPSPNDIGSPIKSTSLASLSRPSSRPILQARSPAPKLNTTVSKSTPLTAPAGRSPTRKRIGILNRRRTASPFTRIDPPRFGAPAPSSAPFSIDAALSGTIPSYGARQAQRSRSTASDIPQSLHEPETKDTWFFDIHEDTAEETMTNLMEHSTYTLDISSDEESSTRSKDERGKENVPPMDDVSQTRFSAPTSAQTQDASSQDLKVRIKSSRRRREIEMGAIDVDRSPLGDLAAEDFYAEGCDEASVVVVQEEAETDVEDQEEVDVNATCTFDFVAEPLPEFDVVGKGKGVEGRSVKELMLKDDKEMAPAAAVLCPIEKAEEGWSVWESGSAKGDE